MVDGLAEHPVLGEPLGGSAVKIRYAIVLVTLQAVQKVLREKVVVFEPRSVGVGPAQEEIAIFDLFEDASTAAVIGERSGQSAANLLGDARRQQKIQ
jgi:hypothetical protein